jgi:hypothetical protein
MTETRTNSRTHRRDLERCATKGCTRILTGKSVTVARDGRRFCKTCGDRLPRFLRGRPRIPEPLTDG